MTTDMLPRQITGLRRRDSLDAEDRAEMFALLSQHFEGVEREHFERDLVEKNWVVEIRREGKLLGFSTLLVGEAEFEGRALTAIYSGDTIVSPEGWGSPALARNWIAAVDHLRGQAPARPCYWLLLTSGFRTYRFLPVFWNEFYPRDGVETPPYQRRLRDSLALQRYGTQYEPAAGIVRFPQPQRLRQSLSVLAENRTGNPDVAFFFSNNPGHDQGDELVCLAEISAANLTRAGRRMITESAG